MSQPKDDADIEGAVEAALAADREAALRDVFAAAALSGMIGSASIVDRAKVNKVTWARVAYVFADAMMKARADSPEQNAARLNRAMGSGL